MLSAIEFVLSFLVVAFGSTVMALVSFGLGMVLSPFLLLMLDPTSVVLTINSLTILILGFTLARSKQDVSVKDVTPLALGGLLGAPVGVLILNSAGPSVLRVAIAGIILALVIPSALNLQRPFSRTNLTSPVAGFLGSMLVTGMGVGTPLVVLYLVNQAWPVKTIRASLAFYSTVVAIAAITARYPLCCHRSVHHGKDMADPSLYPGGAARGNPGNGAGPAHRRQDVEAGDPGSGDSC